MRHILSEKSSSYASYASYASYVRCVCRKKKDIRRKSNGFELLPPSADGSPPSKREVWGLRRSRPSALPSIAYRGFAVAPITLRAPARSVVVKTSEINGRAMRAPTGGRRCNRLLQMHPTVAMMQPSVANASHSCSFSQRCRGAHRAPADILQTLDFPSPRPPSSREGDHPQVVEGVRGGRSSSP